MGRASRHTPVHLGCKLAQVRKFLGIERFSEMVERLNVKEVNLYRSTICEYETGKREPPLIVLLRYSQLAGVSINDLVDDNVTLDL